ncbi:MAG: chemotaxis protein CheW [Pseudomonadales bacterium]|nr:chemotaxis protein CheW [Pseudomonadales bacterium]
MKAQETIERELNDIASLLLPVVGQYLLLPGVSVAEIVGFLPPEDRGANAPDWFLGYVEWRKLKVPVISFEVMNGQPLPEAHENNRIAVLNNTGQSKSLPFFAIVTQATPRLMRISESEIDEINSAQLNKFENMRVRVQEEEATIPAFVEMEKALIRFLGL